MSLDPSIFQSITPSNYTTFTFPNPFPPPHHPHLHTPLLHISILDSPSPSPSPPSTAAMLIPLNRETDWTFSTLSGHLELLLAPPHLSRLILISNFPNHPYPISYKVPRGDNLDDPIEIQEKLMPLLMGLAPKLDFLRNGEVLEVPFLRYEDEVEESEVLEILEGGIVGEMLVEDVVLRFDDGGEDFRRRLRFKRMPNLVQTQMRICGDSGGRGRFCVDDGVLVQPYLIPMVAGMMVIGGCLDERVNEGLRPRALCLGVGGGALIRFLDSRLGFEVFGVEEDEMVLQVGRKYFGLESSESVHLCVADAIETIEKLAYRGSKSNSEVSSGYSKGNGWCLNSLGSKFDVIMVDLDSGDAKLDTCVPPMQFISKSVFMAAKTVLCDFGAIIINVIPPTKSFYEKLTNELMEVFAEVYEIDIGNEENFVLIASVSDEAASGDCDNAFTNKLRGSISESYIDAIRKISKSAK